MSPLSSWLQSPRGGSHNLLSHGSILVRRQPREHQMQWCEPPLGAGHGRWEMKKRCAIKLKQGGTRCIFQGYAKPFDFGFMPGVLPGESVLQVQYQGHEQWRSSLCKAPTAAMHAECTSLPAFLPVAEGCRNTRAAMCMGFWCV